MNSRNLSSGGAAIQPPSIFLTVFLIVRRQFFIQSFPQIDHGSAAMASGFDFIHHAGYAAQGDF